MKFNYNFILKLIIAVAILIVLYLSLKDFNKKENFIIGCSNNIPYSKKLDSCKQNNKDPYNIKPYKFNKKDTFCQMIKNKNQLANKKHKKMDTQFNCLLNRHNQRVCNWK